VARAIQEYFATLVDSFGSGWNRFWYTPSDPATLGQLRIWTGLAAIYVHLMYSLDLIRWFGPGGMLSRELVDKFSRDQYGNPVWSSFSYLNLLSSPTELWFGHIVGMIVLILFTVGFYSRVSSVLALMVTLSYIHRAPMLTGMAEPILALLMFYICLGPNGAAYSVDQLLKRRKQSDSPQNDVPTKYFSATIAIRLVQVHLSVAYLMMGIGKIAESGDTWWGGTAVWWLLAKPESALIDLTHVLNDSPYLVNFWTHAIVAFEIGFALLIWNRLARPLLLAIAIPMWLSLGVILGEMTFPILMLVGNLAFFSPAVIRQCFKRPQRETAKADQSQPTKPEAVAS
jgi:hypothetical protein